jgi:hypothetical protein
MIVALLQLCTANPVPMPADLAINCKNPVLPASALPSTTLRLAYVAIGRGVQNYTCANTSTTPVALGAIANLFDATALARSNIKTLHTIPGLAVNTPAVKGKYVLPQQFRSLPALGNHLFLADGTPTFELTSVRKKLFSKKSADVKAPANAPKGPLGTGAVDWLQLGANPIYTSVGLSLVYRVETAGGNPPTTCTTTGVVTVPYAAEYWFYQ